MTHKSENLKWNKIAGAISFEQWGYMMELKYMKLEENKS